MEFGGNWLGGKLVGMVDKFEAVKEAMGRNGERVGLGKLMGLARMIELEV